MARTSLISASPLPLWRRRSRSRRPFRRPAARSAETEKPAPATVDKPAPGEGRLRRAHVSDARRRHRIAARRTSARRARVFRGGKGRRDARLARRAPRSRSRRGSAALALETARRWAELDPAAERPKQVLAGLSGGRRAGGDPRGAISRRISSGRWPRPRRPDRGWARRSCSSTGRWPPNRTRRRR